MKKWSIVCQPEDRVPGGGSVAIWTQELTHRLADRAPITVFSRAHPGQAERESIDGVSHVRVTASSDLARQRWIRFADRRLRRRLDLFDRHYFGPRYFRGYARDIARRCAEEGSGAILVHNFAQFVPELRRANPDARIVLMMHCDWLVELDPARTESWISQADAICGCSRHIAAGVARRFPALADRCHPVLNGSNPDRFDATEAVRGRAERLRSKLGIEGKTVILFTGRVVPEKGIHVLVEAFRRVRTERPESVLLVVGSFSQQPPSPLWTHERDARFAAFEALKGDYRQHLERLADDLGDAVRIVGRVDYEELPDWYAMSDLFVHPAIWDEPFGMTLTEAMGCGRPVVSTRAGGIPEIVVDGHTGLLVPPGDAPALAEAILALAADPARRAAMGARGRERLKQSLTWEHTAGSMEAVLRG